MGRKYYPVKYSPNRRYPVRKKTPLPNMFNSGAPNIFANNQTLKHEVNKGRIHCVAVERTAIYKDASGNKIVLKENQTTMNAPETITGVLEFGDDRRGKWRKK